MATIKDIATRLGVSVSTVSKGLNGASDISEELRQMVLDTAVEMGYATKKSKKKCSKWYFFDILLHKNDLYKKYVEFLGINKRL